MCAKVFTQYFKLNSTLNREIHNFLISIHFFTVISVKAKKFVYGEIECGTFPISSFCDVTLILKQKKISNKYLSNKYLAYGNSTEKNYIKLSKVWERTSELSIGQRTQHI